MDSYKNTTFGVTNKPRLSPVNSRTSPMEHKFGTFKLGPYTSTSWEAPHAYQRISRIVKTLVLAVSTRVSHPQLQFGNPYSEEVLGFSDVIASGNPTPYYGPIVSTFSPTLTPFGDSDFLLEEVDAFLALEDDQLHTELKICEAKNDKSSIDEPPEVELKDLPPHLEYAFLEGDNKLPVIIAKDLMSEKSRLLIKVFESHTVSHRLKLLDIKGINPEFCTHKILMEEDYKPAVQHQRRVNPKIHDVIKKEVEKLLDARLIYSISDSPWVSPVHCVPKKCGFTVVENDENELIMTQLVKGWRVYIDYRKLNEATRKDHFPTHLYVRIKCMSSTTVAGNEF
ncbi:hypothetical protein Tco_0120782 [Tanacetum coccineum]